jgi:hypothetical protein
MYQRKVKMYQTFINKIRKNNYFYKQENTQKNINSNCGDIYFKLT